MGKIAGSQRRKLANPNHIVKTVVDPLVAAASRSMERMEREQQHGQHGGIGGDGVLDDQTVDQIGSNLLPYFQDNSFENVNSENLSPFSSKKNAHLQLMNELNFDVNGPLAAFSDIDVTSGIEQQRPVSSLRSDMNLVKITGKTCRFLSFFAECPSDQSRAPTDNPNCSRKC